MKGEIETKRAGYGKLVYRLRQEIDLYRVIGLNADELNEQGQSKAFWWHLEMLSHQSIATTICKMFEREDRHERDSIPAIINGLADLSISAEQIEAVVRFASKYGVSADFCDLKGHLWCSLYCFECSNRKAFDELKAFRNKHVAHRQSGFELSPLPSIESFERFYSFGYDFFCVVTDTLLGIGTDVFDSRVGRGAIKVMKKLGIANPKYDFE